MATTRTRPETPSIEAYQMLGRPGFGTRIPTTRERPKDTLKTMLRLWGYLRRRRAAVAVVALTVIGSVVVDLLGPLLLGRAVDRYLLKRDMAGLARNCALMLFLYVMGAVFNWLQNSVMAAAAQRTMHDLRAEVFAKMHHLELRFFDRRPSGELMSRFTSDMENLNLALSSGVAQITSGLFSTVAIAVTMLILNPLLAVLTLAIMAGLTLGGNRWMAHRTRAAFRRQQESLGKLNGLIEETISGLRVVKAYRREPTALLEFDGASAEIRVAATEAQTVSGMVGPMMNTINNIGLAVVGCVGGVMALRGIGSIGAIATFVNYTRQFGRPLNDIANLYNTLQAAMAGSERVFAILDEPLEADADGVPPLRQVRGDVVFENVGFAYVPGIPVLTEISLRARAGEVIALIGPTGAGKTTIVNLLTRFYEIDQGTITLDGVDIRRIRKEDLRRQVGIVLQDTYLFAGSVRDNIRYGRLEATDDEIVAAAQLANAHAFIAKLPDGYDTVLSERGANLSQGQRQLLAISRAALANPRILILDEATSSVDTRTERHLQDAMRHLMRDRTSFVIAHRLSTIRDADQILVIDQGRIAEQGNHVTLMARKGIYHRMATQTI